MDALGSLADHSQIDKLGLRHKFVTSQAKKNALTESVRPKRPTRSRCRAQVAHIRQSRPASGLGFQVKARKTFEVVPFSLGDGTRCHRNVQRIRGGLVFKAHRLCVSGVPRAWSRRPWREASPLCAPGAPTAGVKVCISGSEAGSYLRLIDSCITQRKAQRPSRTCNK